MIINLEKLANKLTLALFRDGTNMNEVELAKIEYGFSLTLGILIGFSLAVLISVLLGTTFYTVLLMLSALGLRFFTGGAHCSSFDRCTLFTLLVFIPISVMVKNITVNLEPGKIIVVYIVAFSCVLISLIPQNMKVAIVVLTIIAVIILLSFLLSGKFLSEIMLSVATGLLIQRSMATKLGGWFVDKVDLALKIVRI